MPLRSFSFLLFLPFAQACQIVDRRETEREREEKNEEEILGDTMIISHNVFNVVAVAPAAHFHAR